MSVLSEKIIEKARELGIHKIGFAPAAALSGEAANLQEWLGRGYNGNMLWMERDPEKRSDPRLLFPPAKTVITAAVNYFTPHRHTESAMHGKISRYAWGDDYHDIVKAKLTALLEWIKAEVPEAEGKVCVDTAPIMDKAWAVRGGLGWIGKHSNLITQDHGSWVFKGEILLNLELEYETDPVAEHCGSCTKCLEPVLIGHRRTLLSNQPVISYAT